MATSDQALLDLLSEMIAVERDGQRLYAQMLTDAPAEGEAPATADANPAEWDAPAPAQ